MQMQHSHHPSLVPELLYELPFGDPQEEELSLCGIHVLSCLALSSYPFLSDFIVSILQGENLFDSDP
jgi:hypothetical protein